MNSSEVLIRARGLTKQYDNFMAVDHIDFEVIKGDCIGRKTGKCIRIGP
jgi:ABC-type Fe3+/spermidine/putrescine transport system ATPase subunit